jgi:hypothetical protein
MEQKDMINRERHSVEPRRSRSCFNYYDRPRLAEDERSTARGIWSGKVAGIERPTGPRRSVGLPEKSTKTDNFAIKVSDETNTMKIDAGYFWMGNSPLKRLEVNRSMPSKSRV